MRRVSGTFHYFRKDMEDKKSKNKWVLGATGYVGQLVTHRLFTERANANWTGQRMIKETEIMKNLLKGLWRNRFQWNRRLTVSLVGKDTTQVLN